MKAPREIAHPVFGQLSNKLSDLWVGTIAIQLFGSEATVELLVDIDEEEGVEPQQIAAFSQFVGNQAEMLEAAEKAILKHYQQARAEYLPDHDEYPDAASVADMAPLVTATGITLPYAMDKPTIGLLCECVWEQEHGLAVKFESGNIGAVGYQDIVL